MRVHQSTQAHPYLVAALPGLQRTGLIGELARKTLSADSSTGCAGGTLVSFALHLMRRIAIRRSNLSASDRDSANAATSSTLGCSHHVSGNRTAFDVHDTSDVCDTNSIAMQCSSYLKANRNAWPTRTATIPCTRNHTIKSPIAFSVVRAAISAADAAVQRNRGSGPKVRPARRSPALVGAAASIRLMCRATAGAPRRLALDPLPRSVDPRLLAYRHYLHRLPQHTAQHLRGTGRCAIASANRAVPAETTKPRTRTNGSATNRSTARICPKF